MWSLLLRDCYFAHVEVSRRHGVSKGSCGSISRDKPAIPSAIDAPCCVVSTVCILGAHALEWPTACWRSHFRVAVLHPLKSSSAPSLAQTASGSYCRCFPPASISFDVQLAPSWPRSFGSSSQSALQRCHRDRSRCLQRSVCPNSSSAVREQRTRTHSCSD